MSKIDNSWIIIAVIVVVLIALWKPIFGLFGKMSDKATNKEQYERGKTVFYDTVRWGGPDSYMSCAMCHAADFTPDPNKEIKMQRYKAGEPVLLKKISAKYSGGITGGDEKLYEQVMSCLTAPDKMQCGTVTMNAPFMDDLLFFVMKQ